MCSIVELYSFTLLKRCKVSVMWGKDLIFNSFFVQCLGRFRWSPWKFSCMCCSVKCGEPTFFPQGAHFLFEDLKSFRINTSMLYAHCLPLFAWGNFSPSALYLSFPCCIRRRGPSKNHHNNRRSGGRLAVQFHCAPSLYPPPHSLFLSPLHAD